MTTSNGSANAYVSGAEPSYGSGPADSANGQWMSTGQLMKRFGFSYHSYIYTRLAGHGDSIPTRKQGGRMFYFVTGTNEHVFVNRGQAKKSRTIADYNTRDALVLENTGWAERLAGHALRSFRLDAAAQDKLKDDLINEALLGLTDVAGGYNSSRGVDFQAFAYRRVRGAIYDFLRENLPLNRGTAGLRQRITEAEHSLEGRLGRRPHQKELAAEMGIGLEGLHASIERIERQTRMFAVYIDSREFKNTEENGNTGPIDSLTPYEQSKRAETAALVAGAIAGLDPRQRKVVNEHYANELSMKRIGGLIGVSESRASQLHGIALQKLRDTLKEKGITELSDVM